MTKVYGSSLVVQSGSSQHNSFKRFPVLDYAVDLSIVGPQGLLPKNLVTLWDDVWGGT